MKKRKILGSLVIIALLFISCTNPFFKDFLVSENSTTNPNKTNAQVPKISSHSNSEITVTLNENFTLTIEASISDGGTLSYQWYENDVKKTEGSAMIAGETEPEFKGSIGTASQLFYYCVVKNTNETVNGDKIAKKMSNFFSVKAVAEINAESPSISAQPVSDSDVEKDSTKTLSITASVSDSGTLSYQWYSNTTNSNSGGTAITGATNSSYTIPTTSEGTYHYYCVVTNTNNTVNGNTTATTSSAVAEIKVIATKDAETPTISSHPQSNTVSINTVVELTILASVSDGGVLSYQWYSNNTNSNSGGTAITGATNSSYTIPTTSEGTFHYYCEVTNTNNSVNGKKTATATSDIAEVIVNDLINAETPRISDQPQTDTNVIEGDTKELTISASVSDGGVLSYQWYSNNTNSNSGGTAITGATNSSYTIPTTSEGTFHYYCVVTNTNNTVNGNTTATTSSAVAIIKVIEAKDAETPTISSHPQSNTVSINTVVELTILASVSDGGVLSYQWYSNNTNSNSGGTAITGATNSSYTIPTTSEGTFHYYCEVTNTNNGVDGNKTATTSSAVAIIKVIEAKDAETPTISSHPQSNTVSINTVVELTILASVSDGGTLSYQWYSNNTNSNSGGTAITAATNSSYTVPTTSVGTTYYYCAVTNTNSSATGTKTATKTSTVATIEVKSNKGDGGFDIGF